MTARGMDNPTLAVGCPHCAQPPGARCKDRQGRPLPRPHKARRDALRDTW